MLAQSRYPRAKRAHREEVLYNDGLVSAQAKTKAFSAVAVAQLVESRIVIPVVVGSSPIGHPNRFQNKQPGLTPGCLFLHDRRLADRPPENPSGVLLSGKFDRV